jgi:hypothetical protein
MRRRKPGASFPSGREDGGGLDLHEAAPADHRFVMRVAEFLRDEAVEVRQGGRVLHRERYRALVPNRCIRLPGGWTRAVVSDGGPVLISTASRPREGEAR